MFFLRDRDDFSWKSDDFLDFPIVNLVREIPKYVENYPFPQLSEARSRRKKHFLTSCFFVKSWIDQLFDFQHFLSRLGAYR